MLRTPVFANELFLSLLGISLTALFTSAWYHKLFHCFPFFTSVKGEADILHFSVFIHEYLTG